MVILGPLRKNEEEEERPHWDHYKKKKVDVRLNPQEGYLYQTPPPLLYDAP